MADRRDFLIGAGAMLAISACGRKEASLGPKDAQARKLVDARPSLDLHAHPGRTFIRDGRNFSPAIRLFAAGGAFESRVLKDMAAGGMNAAVFSAVSDIEVLDLKGEGLSSRRAFNPGEAFESYKRQIAALNDLFANGLAEKILSADDLRAAKRNNKIGAIIGVEGGDFLEGSAERVFEAYEDGVRCINPVHYRTNEIGDIMTETPAHGGLTAAGSRVVRAMCEAGIVIDLAHAAEKTAFGILEAATKPAICSHTHIRTADFDFPRFISLDLAKEIARSGGVIGAWPAGIGITDLDGFVVRIFELVDAVGVDHVGLGSDMDANYKPVWDNYRQFPEIVAKMLERGLSEEETAKVIGGNGLRVFENVAAT